MRGRNTPRSCRACVAFTMRVERRGTRFVTTRSLSRRCGKCAASNSPAVLLSGGGIRRRGRETYLSDFTNGETWLTYSTKPPSPKAARLASVRGADRRLKLASRTAAIRGVMVAISHARKCTPSATTRCVRKRRRKVLLSPGQWVTTNAAAGVRMEIVNATN